MTPRRVALGVATVLTAVLLQTAVLTRLPLPGGAPELMLVLVVAFALAEGAQGGMLTGFAAGLVADLAGDHELGRSALVLTVVGYAAGLLHDPSYGRRDRSVLASAAVVGLAAAGAVTLYAAEGLLLGDPRIGAASYARALSGTVPYSVLLAPLVVPGIAALLDRLDADPLRSRGFR